MKTSPCPEVQIMSYLYNWLQVMPSISEPVSKDISEQSLKNCLKMFKKTKLYHQVRKLIMVFKTHLFLQVRSRYSYIVPGCQTCCCYHHSRRTKIGNSRRKKRHSTILRRTSCKFLSLLPYCKSLK